jgi:opacity protein-like surface antigen
VGIVGWRSAWTAALVLAALVVAARDGQAQTFGIGGRFVFVSGPESPAADPGDDSNTRLAGGFLRLNASRHMTLEVAMDYRSTKNASETARVRSTPIQASAIFYPLRVAVAPYVLAGVGWYRNRVDALDNGDPVLTAESTEFGYHTGVGGQVMLGRHAAFFLDYRYVWVDGNGIDGFSGALRSAASLDTVLGLLGSSDGASGEDSSVSRRGSMWTTGLAIYF